MESFDSRVKETFGCRRWSATFTNLSALQRNVSNEPTFITLTIFCSKEKERGGEATLHPLCYVACGWKFCWIFNSSSPLLLI
ncbi:MAG: hypothetical protein A3E60_00190 [Candidatus Kerfeldbacteria bacterium RIFCSPHIGHO2_12_FULL_42_13]|nr:MAG: hypothetical protein A3E60_00190 [Candidatus Kerfeldbacteria bacterium RIFCSPHIGHO2_12_FULL_42_13]